MSDLFEAAVSGGVVVVGAGQAGGRAVEALRAAGFTGAITLIGEEPHLPYERPSLSKEMILDLEKESIAWIREDGYYEQNGIKLKLGVKALKIDREKHLLSLSDGSEISYGVLILATGARVRKLPVEGASPETVHYLRTLDDSRKLRTLFGSNVKVGIIGGGFIGLEVAAAARQRGCRVTVLEQNQRLLSRVVPASVGEFYKKLHEDRGISFRFGVSPVSLQKQTDALHIEMSTGEDIDVDVIVAGIGVIPNTELAEGAGLKVDRGIIVDEFGATSDPSIFAAGDVAQHYNPLYERHILLESWQNAQNQAIAIARNITSKEAAKPYSETPWFWSDQYSINLQIYGLPVDGGEYVLRGGFVEKSWILFQMDGSKIAYAVGINAGRELRVVRELINLGASVNIEELVDTNKKLTEILQAEKRKKIQENISA